MSELPRHVALNRTYWDGRAPDWVAPGEERWAEIEPVWGIWRLGHDRQVRVVVFTTGSQWDWQDAGHDCGA